jgi:hypothetical protein
MNMEDKIVRSTLHEALEDAIPSSEINLWKDVQEHLVAGKHKPFQQGEKMETRIIKRRSRLAFAILIVLVLLVITFATPQGRSFAQTILQFFIPAESTSFPLQDSQLVEGAPDQSSPTAEPPSPLISIEEAEQVVGIEAAELPFVPEGYNYLGARLYGDTISIEYAAQGNGSSLIIQQSPTGYNQSDWDRVPEQAIVPVTIGEVEGEFVKGIFVVYPDETSATWNPDASILRLRWVKDGIWFEMTKFGDVEVTEYLDQEGLVELAESLVP